MEQYELEGLQEIPDRYYRSLTGTTGGVGDARDSPINRGIQLGFRIQAFPNTP